MNITLDPKGLWRRQRFEFCNALEDAVNGKQEAWEALEKLGVRRGKEGETRGK